MTPEQLDAIEARAKAASRAPWKAKPWQPSGAKRPLDMVMTPHGCLFNSHNGINDPADGEFVAHARSDVPALVAEVRRLREVLQGLVPLPTSDDTTLTEQAEYGGTIR